MGADDYVTKPFLIENLLHVKANLRRQSTVQATESSDKETNDIEIGDIIIHPDAYYVSKLGETIELTHREFELLYYLADMLVK